MQTIVPVIERVNGMYKVEIKFDPNNLTQYEMDKICEQTDEIFEKEDLDCADREPGQIGRAHV